MPCWRIDHDADGAAYIISSLDENLKNIAETHNANMQMSRKSMEALTTNLERAQTLLDEIEKETSDQSTEMKTWLAVFAAFVAKIKTAFGLLRPNQVMVNSSVSIGHPTPAEGLAPLPEPNHLPNGLQSDAAAQSENSFRLSHEPSQLLSLFKAI